VGLEPRRCASERERQPSQCAPLHNEPRRGYFVPIVTGHGQGMERERVVERSVSLSVLHLASELATPRPSIAGASRQGRSYPLPGRARHGSQGG